MVTKKDSSKPLWSVPRSNQVLVKHTGGAGTRMPGVLGRYMMEPEVLLISKARLSL